MFHVGLTHRHKLVGWMHMHGVGTNCIWRFLFKYERKVYVDYWFW